MCSSRQRRPRVPKNALREATLCRAYEGRVCRLTLPPSEPSLRADLRGLRDRQRTRTVRTDV
jgi:hypothetical protein